MLLAVTLPAKYLRLLLLSEAKEEVVTVAKESMGLVPILCTVATKHPAMLILDDEYRVLHVSTPFIHRDQTAPVYVQTKHPVPCTVPQITGQMTN